MKIKPNNSFFSSSLTVSIKFIEYFKFTKELQKYSQVSCIELIVETIFEPNLSKPLIKSLNLEKSNISNSLRSDRIHIQNNFHQ